MYPTFVWFKKKEITDWGFNPENGQDNDFTPVLHSFFNEIITRFYYPNDFFCPSLTFH